MEVYVIASYDFQADSLPKQKAESLNYHSLASVHIVYIWYYAEVVSKSYVYSLEVCVCSTIMLDVYKQQKWLLWCKIAIEPGGKPYCD